MVPQPVKAVILLFPITESVETRRKQEDEKVKNLGQHPIDPTVFYIKQTASTHELDHPEAIVLTEWYRSATHVGPLACFMRLQMYDES